MTAIENLIGRSCQESSQSPAVIMLRHEIYYWVVCIVLYLFSVQNIYEEQNTVNIQHTDSNKYIKFKVLNIIIKIKLKI
jgi:hypothetical protein